MSDRLNWLKNKFENAEKDDFDDYLSDLNAKNLALEAHIYQLIRNDIQSKNKDNADKINEIQGVYNQFEERRGTKTTAETLRSLRPDIKEKTYTSYHSNIKSYLTKGKGELDKIHKQALSILELLDTPANKIINHNDVGNYLLKHGIHSKKYDSEQSDANTIIGDYLLFRRSNAKKGDIHISHLEIKLGREGFLIFNFNRKSLDGENTQTKGLFLRNTRESFIFLCISAKGQEKDTFIETISVLKNRPLKNDVQDDCLIGIYNGETLSAKFRHPFSSKIAMVRIKKVDHQLLKELEDKDLFKSHPIHEIEAILVNKMDLENQWGDLLERMNVIVPISDVLDKTKNKIDEKSGLFILK